jgi:hypothetical protein
VIAGGSQVQGQPGLHSETMSQRTKTKTNNNNNNKPTKQKSSRVLVKIPTHVSGASHSYLVQSPWGFCLHCCMSDQRGSHSESPC